MKYLSLFSGIGGFEVGLANSKHNFECVGYSEIDKFARSVYERHFPKHAYLGDATKIKTEDLPEFDFLVGGFPCQAFSYAGLRRGFDDNRGTLFFEIARILKDKRPRYFLLENVRGLLSHNKGETFQTILEVLSDLGYTVKWSILNSKDFNVPQRRERVFIEGYSRRECGGKILSFRRPCPENIEGVNNEENQLKCLNPHKAQAQKVYDIEGISPTLSACGGGDGGKTGLYKVPDNRDDPRKIKVVGNASPSNYNSQRIFSAEGLARTLTATDYKHPLRIRESTKKGYKEAYPDDGVELGREGCSVRRGVCHEKSIGALNSGGGWGTVTNDYRIRKLTPKECERLQAFPDDWTKYGKDDEIISDTQRYKCIGNAVTTSVITAIVNNMFEGLE